MAIAVSTPIPEPLAKNEPTQLEPAPPAMSGGTLLRARTGLLVASDPDRDRLYFVDGVQHTLLYTRALQPNDEPGRLVDDAAGRVHVVLRSAAAIASVERGRDGAIVRRAVCDQPRGIAYDERRDLLHVACAEGKLVTLPADPRATTSCGGFAADSCKVALARDARDVVLRADRLFVTEFRAAALTELNARGEVQSRRVAPSTLQDETTFVSMPATVPGCPPKDQVSCANSAGLELE